MKSDLVSVYDAATLMEAQMLASRLEDAGVRSFLDNTDSPFDGVTAMEQTIPVRILAEDETRAGPIVAEFQREQSQRGPDEAGQPGET